MLTPEEIAAAKLKADADAKAKEEADAADALKAKANGEPADDPKELEGKWDPATKKYIEGLRTEAAKHRTDKKQLNERLTNLETGLKTALGLKEDEKPEEKVKVLQQQTEAQAFRLAIMEAAVENGVSGDQVDYFQFLVEKKASSLADGEELSEADMSEIIKTVKKVGASGGGSNATSITSKNAPAPGVNTTDLAVERFAKMSITEKSEIYTKQPELYARLMKETKEKRLLA